MSSSPFSRQPRFPLILFAACLLSQVIIQTSCTDWTADLRKAAERGDADEQYNLGRCYGKGQGVPQSYTEAAKWYRKAAEQGHAKAQYSLGGCYSAGVGVVKDRRQAYGWFLLASAAGCTEATNNLPEVESTLSLSELSEARAWAKRWKPAGAALPVPQGSATPVSTAPPPL